MSSEKSIDILLNPRVLARSSSARPLRKTLVQSTPNLIFVKPGSIMSLHHAAHTPTSARSSASIIGTNQDVSLKNPNLELKVSGSAFIGRSSSSLNRRPSTANSTQVAGNSLRPRSAITNRPQTALAQPLKVTSSGSLSVKSQRPKSAIIQLPSWNGARTINTLQTSPPPIAVIQTSQLQLQKKRSPPDLQVRYNASTPSPPPFTRSFLPSVYQNELILHLLPCRDEIRKVEIHRFFNTHILDVKSMNIGIIRDCVHKLVAEYKILSLQICRNEKIIDADVECVVDETPWEKIEKWKYLSIKSGGSIIGMVEEWKEEKNLKCPFGVLVVDGRENQFIVFGASMAILDERSLIWLSKEFFKLYNDVLNGSLVDSYKNKELESFEDHCYYSKRTNSDIVFWRSQCIQATQEIVDPVQKKSFEKTLAILATETNALNISLLSSTKGRNDFEKELEGLRKQRMAIDQLGDDSTCIIDPTTGESVEMTRAAKEALLRAVLGEAADGDDITPLLVKHEVNIDVQAKMNASKMSLEEFANLTEANINPLDLSMRDRRQILALIDYTRNRIKECVQDRTKVKFGLERQITKCSRGLESFKDHEATTRARIEGNEDMSFRLTNLLHPPYEEEFLKPLTLDSLKIGSGRVGVEMKYFTFTIEEEILANLQRFQSEWTEKIRIKRRKEIGNDYSDNESLLDDSDDDTSPANAYSAEMDSESQKNHSKKSSYFKSSVRSVCLSGFAVLMKHITGNDKFILAQREGPVTDTLPIRIDLTANSLPFSSVFGSIHEIFKKVKRSVLSCPKRWIEREIFKNDLDFAVEYEFISAKELNQWEERGLLAHDLLYGIHDNAGSIQIDKNQQSSSRGVQAVKFTMLEHQTHMTCSVRFNSLEFDEEKVKNWCCKYKSTLEGIDCSQRKLSVTNIISRYNQTLRRYYSKLWKSEVDISQNALTSRESSLFLFSQDNLSSSSL